MDSATENYEGATLVYDEGTAKEMGLPWPPENPRNDYRNYQWRDPFVFVEPEDEDDAD